MKGDRPGGPIRWRMHIPAPPEDVFRMLDSDGGRAAFWAESAIERDGSIEFHFANGFQYCGKVLERRAPARFAIEYFGGRVTFDLEADANGGTDLLLTHDGVPPEEWQEVHAGWLNVLFPLKAWAGFRIDLRNHDSGRTWDDGYADG